MMFFLLWSSMSQFCRHGHFPTRNRILGFAPVSLQGSAEARIFVAWDRRGRSVFVVAGT
jgi:hypothetical protein